MLAYWDRDCWLTLGLGPGYEAAVAPRDHEVKDIVSQRQQLLVVRERFALDIRSAGALSGGESVEGLRGTAGGLRSAQRPLRTTYLLELHCQIDTVEA